MQLASLLVALVLTAHPVAANASGCDMQDAWTQCEVSNSGSSVKIGGERSDLGSGDDGVDSSTDSSSGSDSGSGSSGEDVPGPDESVSAEPCLLNRCHNLFEVEVLTPPEVTVADLVSFVPERPALTGEPVGVGIVGMPVNLLSTASTHTIPGRLFNRDVVVRFTPTGYDLDHGDGTTRNTPDGGTTWERLGQAQFTPTPTSHIYTTRGTYPVTATAHYQADVDFGTGWRPVPGTITATTTGYTVRIVEVHTALVDKTCHENPTGPGC